jgi:hypothetical protein
MLHRTIWLFDVETPTAGLGTGGKAAAIAEDIGGPGGSRHPVADK